LDGLIVLLIIISIVGKIIKQGNEKKEKERTSAAQQRQHQAPNRPQQRQLSVFEQAFNELEQDLGDLFQGEGAGARKAAQPPARSPEKLTPQQAEDLKRRLRQAQAQRAGGEGSSSEGAGPVGSMDAASSEGYCPPDHDHAPRRPAVVQPRVEQAVRPRTSGEGSSSGEGLGADELSFRRAQRAARERRLQEEKQQQAAGMNLEELRRAVIMAEVLKRPKPGVAPRKR
jgi:hypothetical protein